MRSCLPMVPLIMILFTAVGCSKKPPAENPAENPDTNTSQSPQPADPAVADDSAENSGSTEPKKGRIGVKAHPLEGLTWVQGKPVNQFKPGHAYVVEFWATWCGPCRTSIPHLTEIQNRYIDSVTVIGVSNETANQVKPFVEQMGDKMDYTVAVDIEGKVHEQYSLAFNEQAIPHAFVVDGTGRIVWVGHPMSDLEAVLEKVVQGTFDHVAYANEKTEQQKRMRQLREWVNDYFTAVQQGKANAAITQIAQSFIENADAQSLNGFAWDILTRVPEGNRQLDIALKAAEKANRLTDAEDPSILDTYALALFEIGKVKEAVETQQKAIQLLDAMESPSQGVLQMKAEFSDRLKKFQKALTQNIS